MLRHKALASPTGDHGIRKPLIPEVSVIGNDQLKIGQQLLRDVEHEFEELEHGLSVRVRKNRDVTIAILFSRAMRLRGLIEEEETRDRTILLPEPPVQG